MEHASADEYLFLSMHENFSVMWYLRTLSYTVCSAFILQEPKLTRSHVRQAVASSVARGAVSPEKIVSCCIVTHCIPPWEGSMCSDVCIHC